MSFLDDLPFLSPDPLLSVAQQAERDHRIGKLDLTIGVYKDRSGQTPIFKSVKSAESSLVQNEITKSYLSTEGVPTFCNAITDLILSPHDVTCNKLATVQTLGGTGALSLAGRFLSDNFPESVIWIGTPTWSNHVAVMRQCGLNVQTYARSLPTGGRNFAALMDVLTHKARRGDIILLQPICHNPTGDDWNKAEWDEITAQIVKAGLLPLVDIAYHGLGQDLASDLTRLHTLVEQTDVTLVCYSCSKNFGLYRDRVGALLVAGQSNVQPQALQSQLAAIARTNYSMPPAHGALTVGHILTTPALRQQWENEVESMQAHLHTVRTQLAAHKQIGPCNVQTIATGRGMFCMLPLPPTIIMLLRNEYSIYMADNGRINLAALNENNLLQFVALIDRVWANTQIGTMRNVNVPASL
ncbi:aromatic amino acid transaminase [Acetobacter senegalensis]|uniref:aromatic amino acid transaminase n=1 Tax=Acetobacter senegalensis TaxID=446692 RepID=UPI001ED9FAFD|nr:aromatic amino acid transaminase [Acetobacter senegalensis]MCG4254082.1 aromatic amino acid transaminase [Acetobacter senegalensis]MCP1194289.1 aromatic amino acid transaminase [Acetobacter senegalensis]